MEAAEVCMACKTHDADMLGKSFVNDLGGFHAAIQPLHVCGFEKRSK